MKKRNASGSGSIRRRKCGAWEARYTVGRDSNGRQIQRSIYGSTQDEVRQKLTAVINSIDQRKYIEPSCTTLAEWLRFWLDAYAKNSTKDHTFDHYQAICENHIIPKLGSLKLQNINTADLQRLYTDLIREKNLSAKTIRNINSVIRPALQQAVNIKLIASNPAENCVLPRYVKPKIRSLEDDEIRALLAEIKGTRFENLLFLSLFSGARQSEILGLTWNCVNFDENSILIDKQLQKIKIGDKNEYSLVSTKTDRERVIVLSPYVMTHLKMQKAWQDKCKEQAGTAWNNKWNLVFTNELGLHIAHVTVYKNFKSIARKIGLPDTRFHDLRHTYAVISLESGSDVKTLQEFMGHSKATTTLDIYSHVSRTMKLRAADNQTKYIESIM